LQLTVIFRMERRRAPIAAQGSSTTGVSNIGVLACW
jgi:hypothetical protein